MADKMLKIAARGEDGTAKPIKSDNQGNIGVKMAGSVERKVYSTISIPANSEVIAITEEAKGFAAVRLAATGSSGLIADLEFFFSSADTIANLFNPTRAYILQDKMDNLGASPTNFNTKDFPLHGKFFGIKIKNNSAEVRNPHSITLSLISAGNFEKKENKMEITNLPSVQTSTINNFPAKQKVEFVGGTVDSFTLNNETGSLTSGKATLGANSAVVFVENPDVSKVGVFAEGRLSGTSIFVRIPFIDSNRIIRAEVLNQTGVYHIDLNGFDLLRIRRIDSTSVTNVTAVMTTMECVKPIDAPVRYIRITPESGIVEGNFRAIEPLTDIELSQNIRFSLKAAGDTGRNIFVNGDLRMAGQTLFGPYDRVQVLSGVALLVIQ